MHLIPIVQRYSSIHIVVHRQPKAQTDIDPIEMQGICDGCWVTNNGSDIHHNSVK